MIEISNMHWICVRFMWKLRSITAWCSKLNCVVEFTIERTQDNFENDEFWRVLNVLCIFWMWFASELKASAKYVWFWNACDRFVAILMLFWRKDFEKYAKSLNFREIYWFFINSARAGLAVRQSIHTYILFGAISMSLIRIFNNPGGSRELRYAFCFKTINGRR